MDEESIIQSQLEIQNNLNHSNSYEESLFNGNSHTNANTEEIITQVNSEQLSSESNSILNNQNQKPNEEIIENDNKQLYLQTAIGARNHSFDNLSPIPQDSYNSDLSDDEFVECNDEIEFLQTPMQDTDSKKQFDGGHLEWKEEAESIQAQTQNNFGEIPDDEILKGFVIKNLDDGSESNLYEHLQAVHPFFTQLVMRDKLNPNEEDEEQEKKDKRNKKGLSATIGKFLSKKKDDKDDLNKKGKELISPEPTTLRSPNQMRVHCKRKKVRQFTDLRAVESIFAHDGAIWCMEFSINGDFLATAGQDGNICIWKVNKNKYRDSLLEKGKDLRENNSFLSSTTSTPIPFNDTLYSEKKKSLNDSNELNVNDLKDISIDKLNDSTTDSQEQTESNTTNIAESQSKEYPRWISKKPVQFFKSKQRSDVVALAWSKRNFLISSSMDHRVSVWHVTKQECLVSFKHNELVTSVAFHPEDDSLFVTGSFDEKVRLFNLRSRELVSFVDTKSMITAIGFAEQGKTLVAGTYDGKCIFYSLRGTELSRRTIIDVRSRRGKNKGKKVTGVVASPDQRGILVTTNDSRVRVYSLVDFSEMCKFKGFVNTSSQIKATYNLEGSMILSGSENHNVYLWSVNKDLNIEKKKISALRKKSVIDSYESFKNSDSTVTNCLFAPFQFSYSSDFASTYGTIIATSNYKGELCIYESLGAPEKN